MRESLIETITGKFLSRRKTHYVIYIYIYIYKPQNEGSSWGGGTHIYIYIYMYTYMYIYIYIYLFICNICLWYLTASTQLNSLTPDGRWETVCFRFGGYCALYVIQWRWGNTWAGMPVRSCFFQIWGGEFVPDGRGVMVEGVVVRSSFSIFFQIWEDNLSPTGGEE